MALSITASNVVPGSNASLSQATAGEAITAGMPIVVVAGVAYKTNNAGNDRAGTCHGIAAHSTLTGQPCNYQSSGDLAVGTSVLTQGAQYYVGNADGEIEEVGSLSENASITILGTARDDATLALDIRVTGIAKAA